MSDVERTEEEASSPQKDRLENEELMGVMSECNDYLSLQSELENALSSGIFLQAKAKKGGHLRMNSIDNMREDFDAVVRVDEGTDGNFTEWKTKPKVDPMLYLTAMPSRDLRHAQESFKKALSISVSLASKSRKINSQTAKVKAHASTPN